MNALPPGDPSGDNTSQQADGQAGQTPRVTLNLAGICLYAGPLVSRPGKIFQARLSLTRADSGTLAHVTAQPLRHSAGVYFDAGGGGTPPLREAGRKGYLALAARRFADYP